MSQRSFPEPCLPPHRLQLQQQIAQLWTLAGKACLDSLAHPPPLADLLGAWAHAVVPVHHLFEQLGGHTCVGQGAVGMARLLVKIDAKPCCRIAQRDTPVAAHIHDRGVKRLQVGPVRGEGGKVDALRLTLGQKLSPVRPAPADHLGGVTTDPIAEPFDHHVERIGHRGVHGRYPRELADGIRNAFGIFRLHKLRELTHHVAAVIELDRANLDNLVTQPAALTLPWHRRKLKVEHNLARKVRRIDSLDTRRLFVWHGQGLSPSTAARYIGGYIAVRIGSRADIKAPSAAIQHSCRRLHFELVSSLLLSNIYSYF